MISRYNDWDYDSMGLKVNEILELKSRKNFQDYVAKIQKEYDYSIIRVDESDRFIRKFLEKNDYKMKEVVYEMHSKNPLQISTAVSTNCEIREECDPSELSNLAYNMFRHGRYLEDPEIPMKLGNARNSSWVLQMHNSDLERQYLFCREKLIGFLFYRTEENIELVLGGVENRYQHLSYYFWNELFQKYKRRHFETTISATNLGALKLYTRFGFSPRKIKVGYHLKTGRENEA